MLSLPGVTFAVFCFFRPSLYSFVEAAALRSQSLFDMHAPRQQHVVMYLETIRVLFFLFFGDAPFLEYFGTTAVFSVWRVRRTFFASEWCFLACDNGLDF